MELSKILQEKYDQRKLRYIIDHSTELDLPKIVKKLDKFGNQIDKMAQVDILRKYMKKTKKGRAPVEYKVKNNGTGRYVVTKSEGLACFSKKIRHTICSEYYYDVDMVNCHPVILRELAIKANLRHENLDKYIDNRQVYFDELSGCGLTRNDSKITFLRLIYGGVLKEHEKTANMISYEREIRCIMDVIYNQKDVEQIRKIASTKKYAREWNGNTLYGMEYNPRGSACALYIQDIERKILDTTVRYFEASGVHPSVYIHDGFMVDKDKLSRPKLEKLLRGAEEAIFQEHNYKISLIEKEMEEMIHIPDQVVRTYEQIKVDFEVDHFKNMKNGKFYTTSYGTGRETIIKSKTDMITTYEHLKYDAPDGETCQFIKQWMEDEDIRTYSDANTYPPPLEVPEGHFNMWYGFDVEYTERIETEEIIQNYQRIKDHIKLLSNDREDIYEYFMKWLASMFQFPGRKPNVAILIKSIQGMGKDIFFEGLENMLGGNKSFNTDAPEDYLLQKFNSSIEGKILIGINEISASIGYKYSNKLLNLQTRAIDNVKVEGIPGYKSISCTHFMYFTNNNFAVKVTKDDRRFMLIELNKTLEERPSKEYFDNLRIALWDKHALRILFEELMQIDIKSFDFVKDRPHTDYTDEMKEVSRDVIIDYILQILEREETATNDKIGAFKYVITANEMYEEFVEKYHRDKMTRTMFGIILKKVQGLTDGDTPPLKKARRSKGVVYVMDLKMTREWATKMGHDTLQIIDEPEEGEYGDFENP